jgi:hypothetical protein
MAGSAESQHPGVGPFDVPRWLAELTGVSGWSLQRTFTRRKVEYVAAYTGPDGQPAEVTMQAIPVAGRASWQLVSRAGPNVAGVVIPAHTRITW